MVYQLQEDFDKNVIRFKAQEVDNIRHQAKLLSDMSPAGAVAMLQQMPDDEAVRILFTMKSDAASPILDAWSKGDKIESKHAAVLTEKLRDILPAPPVTAANP